MNSVWLVSRLSAALRPLNVLRAGFVLALSAVLLAGGAAWAAGEREPLVIHTANGPHTFAVEIADTPEKRAKGLMNRDRLGARHGMLFNFKRPQRVSMWMHNTRISLDMLFVDTKGRIVFIEYEAPPMTQDPRGPSTPVVAVVELRGGVARALGIRPGDTVDHPMFSGPRR